MLIMVFERIAHENCISGLVMALVVLFFTAGCASSRMDVRERVEIPVLLNGQVYTNAFERTDRSKIAPGGPRVIRHGGGGSSFRFSAGVGGGGGYGGSYPVVTEDIRYQEYRQNQTAERYGLGGGRSGSYSPTRSGSYSPTPGGSYSPTPTVGRGYGY